jgi:hypothetical protein
VWCGHSGELLGAAAAEMGKVTTSFVLTVSLSVRPSARNSLAHTGWIFIESDIRAFFLKKSAEKFKND